MPGDDLLGKKLGPYVVRQRLGQGGMGTVYLAHDTALDRLVALKVLDAHYARDKQFVDRFQREARAAARLNHPNIVQIYAVDIDADPPYIVMEYVKGNSLDKHIAANGPFTWQQALTICGQVAAALACAHEQGIIHRDIKPGNILLDATGRARVTDFGIAKVLGANTALTAEKVAVGSPAYMSPEQCGVGEVVPASDLFSLGISLFEALTGRVPYEAETYLGLIKKITQDPLPKIIDVTPNVPPIVQEFVEGLTAKQSGARYAQAKFVIEDLHALREGKQPVHLSGLRKLGAEALPVPLPSVPAARANAPVPAPQKSLVDDLLDVSDTAPVRRLPRREQATGTPWLVAATVIGAVILGAGIAALALMGRGAPPTQNTVAPASAPAPAQPAAAAPQLPPGPPPPAPAGMPQPGQPGYVAPPGYPQAPPPPPGAPPHPPGMGPGFPPPHHPPGFPPPPPPQSSAFEGEP